MMKQVKQLLMRAIAAMAIVILAQSPISSAVIKPLAPPNTDNPRSTVLQFVENTNKAHRLLMKAQARSKQEGGLFHSPRVNELAARAEEAMERAVRTLNLQDVPDASKARVGLESALRLKEILDRITLPNVARIPDLADVEADPSLERWEIPGTEIAIVKGKQGQYTDEYLFSPDTVERLKEFYREVREFPYRTNTSASFDTSEGFYEFYISTAGGLLPPKWSHWLPAWSNQVYFEQTLWQWFGFVLALVVVVAIVGWMYQWRKKSRLHPESLMSAWMGLCFPGVTIAAFYGMEILMKHSLNITGEIDRVASIAIETFLFLLGAWCGFMLTNAIGKTIIISPRFQRKPLEAMMVRNGFRIMGVLAAATILYFGGERLGVPVAPLVASLGVSSIAIGFGAKSFVENIVGGITLFIDRPVKVGDKCEFGGITGTVEDIGLRATRIRTRDRNIVTVPNTEFSTSQLINYSQRDRRLLEFTLSLRPETTRQQLQVLLGKMRSLLDNHPPIEKERVHLVGLGDASRDIQVFAYTLPTDTAEYLQVQEGLLLDIMAIVEEVGTDFADSTPTLYLPGDKSNGQPTPANSVALNGTTLTPTEASGSSKKAFCSDAGIGKRGEQNRTDAATLHSRRGNMGTSVSDERHTIGQNPSTMGA